MYESYWKLDQRPFASGCDPRFYYPGQSHQAALLKLRYAVENRCGGAILAGPSGSGKTLLVGMLRSAIAGQISPVVRAGPGLHIVKVEARRTGGGKSFKEAQEEIRSRLYEEQVGSYRQSYIEELKKAALIEVKIPELRS